MCTSESKAAINSHLPPSGMSDVAKENSTQAEEFIIPSENNEYHEHMLTLLKIKNNPNLNHFFYDNVAQIKKSLIISADLASNENAYKSVVDQITPPELFTKRNICKQYLLRILLLLIISNFVSSL